jgi:8-oxo-dGTP diphosphatase
MSFHGAKAAVFLGDNLLVLLRDDRPDILFPAHWDFPGGGREGDETPFETLARELKEEVGLDLPPAAVVWSVNLPAAHQAGQRVWFSVVQLPAAAVTQIVFGDEGLCWAMMTPAQFLRLGNAVPSLPERLRLWPGLRSQAGPLHWDKSDLHSV